MVFTIQLIASVTRTLNVALTAFRKPNWPPPTDEDVTTDSASGESNGPSKAPESSQGGAAGAPPSQNSK